MAGTMLLQPPLWLQLGIYGILTLWFAGLATVPHQPAGFRALHHAFMAAAMAWLAVLGHALGHHQAHEWMLPLAVYSLLAAVPFLRKREPSHAAMNIGMGVLMLAMV